MSEDARAFGPPREPNPDLRGLGEKLVGTWEMSGDVRGTVTYEWMEGGFFLVQRVDFDGRDGGRITGIEVIGHERPFRAEPSEETGSRFYSSTGETIDYVYELRGDTLTIWAGERGSPAYYRGTFGDDGCTLTGAWHYPGGGGYAATATRIEGRDSTTRGEGMNDPKGNYAEVNGTRMYYEIHGSGEPLVLLHGGLGAIEMFGEVLPLLAEGRRVVAVDLQAHGRTADVDRPLSYEGMADDVAALIGSLGFGKADVMGYSLGGGVALRSAIQHPGVVRKLVVVSTPFRRDGWYPEVLAGMAQMGPEAAEPMKGTPMYELYASVAPRPEDWPMLLTKLGRLLGQDYDWSEEVEGIEAPTMIVVGDADSVRAAHAVRFFELLGGGKADAGWDRSGMPNARLAVLPATTHHDIFYSPTLASTVAPFLDAPMPEAG